MKKKKKIMEYIFSAITYVLAIFLLACLCLWLLGIRPYVIVSGSMEPKMHTGSICVVNTNIEISKLKEGDIIAYKSGSGSLVAHRVLHITKQGIETKGDANDVSDGISVTRNNFVGKAVFSVPYMGYVCRFFQRILLQVFVR